jgi:hypothetical protein
VDGDGGGSGFAGAAVGVDSDGRAVGKLGSLWLPHPGQDAVPSVVLLQLTKVAATTNAAPANASLDFSGERTSSP